MQNKSLLYWILDADGKPQYINSNGNLETGTGVIKTDGSPAHLEYSPEGWLETLVTWVRNNKYLSLFREYTVPMIFRKDGAKILRSVNWRIGMEAVYYLAISKLNRTQFPDKYEPWYTGEFDFSKYRQTDTGVDIQIVEGGLSKLLKAYEGTTYELPVNSDPQKFTLYLDGFPFQNTVENSIFEQSIYGPDFVGGGDWWAIGTGIIFNEGTTQGIASNDQEKVPEQVPTSENCFLKSFTKTTIINVTGSITLRAEPTNFDTHSVVFVTISKYDRKGTLLAQYVIVPKQNMEQGASLVAPFNFNIPVEPGTMLTLYGSSNFEPGQSDPDTTIQLNGSFNYDYLVTFDPTYCECITWMRLFELLTEKITGGKYGCRSNFLSSLDRTQAVSCGQAIRRYQPPNEVQVIKTSFNDFFQAAKSRWGLGLAIENDILVIEKHEYFFRKGISIELGEVKDVEFSHAEDMICNTIKVGYPNKEYDKVNGRDEFNVTQQYITPLTRIVKELDLVCPYRADMYGIEITRLDLYKKDTTDNQADNDTFIMNVVKETTHVTYRGPFTTKLNQGNFIVLPLNGSVFDQNIYTVGMELTFSAGTFTVINVIYIIAGFVYIQVSETVTEASFNEAITTFDADIYHLNRPPYSAISGLLHPAEAFNTELTPKHALANNSAYIHSLLDLQEMNKIKFTTGEKNSLLSTTLGGVTVTQNADVNISSLAPKLFLPYYAKFKTKVLIDLPGIMRLTPYDKIGFIDEGVNYYGYMWSGGTAPAKNDAQEWQLMMAAENNMTKLI